MLILLVTRTNAYLSVILAGSQIDNNYTGSASYLKMKINI